MRYLFLVLTCVCYSIQSFAQSEVSLSIPSALQDTICQKYYRTFRLQITNNDTAPVGYFPIQFDVIDKDGDTTNMHDTIFGYLDSNTYRMYDWTFKPLKAGKYHVKAYIEVWDDTVRTNDTVQFSFFVKPIPEATIAERVVRVCKGDSAHLEIITNTPGTSVEWYATDKPGRPPVNIGKTYDYIPVGTSVSAMKAWKFRIKIANPGYGMQCDYSDTITVEVYSLPKNEFTISGDTLIAGDGEDYQWYRNDTAINGANNKTYIPTKTGNYKVRYAIPDNGLNGCRGNSTNLLVTIIDTTSSFAEIHGNAVLTVFPNPANGVFTVQVPPAAYEKLSVWNALGEMVLTQSIDEKASSIPVEIQSVPSGIYILRLEGPAQASQMKIIKQ